MAIIELKARITDDGRIELEKPIDLPPGDVLILIETEDTEEIAEDARWDKVFADSQDLLAQMSDQALRDLDEGRTIPLDPDTF
jgi:hypothetical protein